MPENPEYGAINEIKALNPEEQRLMEKFAPGTTVNVKRSSGEIEGDWKVRAFVRDLKNVLYANVINKQQEKEKDVPLAKLEEVNP